MEDLDVFYVRALLLHAGYFQYPRKVTQLRVIEHSSERLLTYVTLADILVPVYTCAEGSLRVIRMNCVQSIESYDPLEGLNRFVQAFFGGEIEAGVQEMAGIPAHAYASVVAERMNNVR